MPSKPNEPAKAPSSLIAQTNAKEIRFLPKWWNRWQGRTVRLMALALAVIALWLTIENRWGSNFQLPTRYQYDAHYILGMMKLAQEGDMGLFTYIYTDSLGAPFRGQLNDFPETQRALIWVGGQIARVTGLMPAANILLILSALLSTFSFYFALRLWRVSRLIACFFSLIYAFTPDITRSLHHPGIMFNGLLPLQLYILWYIATSQKIALGSIRFKLSLIIGLLSALFNVYWIFLFISLYLLVLTYRLVRRRRVNFLSTTPLLLTFIVAIPLYGSYWNYSREYEKNANTAPRSYIDVELYSLKPIDLFIPNIPTGPKLSFLSSFTERYESNRLHIGEVWGGTYMGSVSIIGLSVLILLNIYRQINRRPPSLPFLAIIWLIAYCSYGGIHSILCLLFDFYKIRAPNRYSTAILAISLIYMAFFINTVSKKWNVIFKSILIITISVLAIAEQSRLNKTYAYIWGRDTISSEVDNDKQLVSKLESKLPDAAMLFILPATDFPEPFWGRGAYKGDFHHYQAMRPFFYSTKLRYSYGSTKGRQGADWQLDVQELPARKMAAALESYGFSGVLLNRKGYEDRGEQLLAELAEAGWPMEFEQGIDNEWVFIRLTPAAEPVLPTQTPYAPNKKIEHSLPSYLSEVLPKEKDKESKGSEEELILKNKEAEIDE